MILILVLFACVVLALFGLSRWMDRRQRRTWGDARNQEPGEEPAREGKFWLGQDRSGGPPTSS